MDWTYYFNSTNGLNSIENFQLNWNVIKKMQYFCKNNRKNNSIGKMLNQFCLKAKIIIILLKNMNYSSEIMKSKVILYSFKL